MTLYHRTTSQAAVHILMEGLQDGEGTFGTSQRRRGVWVSDRPLDVGEGVSLDADITIELRLDLTEDALADYEWIEDGKPYREWLVPAVVLNRHATMRVATVEL